MLICNKRNYIRTYQYASFVSHIFLRKNLTPAVTPRAECPTFCRIRTAQTSEDHGIPVRLPSTENYRTPQAERVLSFSSTACMCDDCHHCHG